MGDPSLPALFVLLFLEKLVHVGADGSSLSGLFETPLECIQFFFLCANVKLPIHEVITSVLDVYGGQAIALEHRLFNLVRGIRQVGVDVFPGRAVGVSIH